MHSDYLGAIILGASLVALGLAFTQFRKAAVPHLLDNETAAFIASMLVTAGIAAGITVFAGNALLTGLFSTIVSGAIVGGALVVMVMLILFTRSSVKNATAEPFKPAPFTPETPAANANKPASGRSRRKAA